MKALTPTLSILVLAGLSSMGRAQNVLFSDDFEQGGGQWALTGNWRVLGPADPCAAIVAPLPSGSQCLRWGTANVCTFQQGSFTGTATLSTAIALPASAEAIDLSFTTNSHAEDWPAGEWDARRVQLSADGGQSWTTLAHLYTSPWYRHVHDLTSYAGQSVWIRFQFDAVDGYGNTTRGWFVDDLEITARTQAGVPFCFGDWCPCANTGAMGNGCATSFDAAGGHLAATGVASVSADGVVLSCSGVSNSIVTFFQGTETTFTAVTGAASFGDGRRCVTGSVIRLQAVLATAGAARYPLPGDLAISVRGAIPAAGGSRAYQVWYRNAATFCTASTFNLTNGLMVTWRP